MTKKTSCEKNDNETVDFSSLDVLEDIKLLQTLPPNISEEISKRFYKYIFPDYNGFIEIFSILRELDVPKNKIQDFYKKYMRTYFYNIKDDNTLTSKYNFFNQIISNIAKNKENGDINNKMILEKYYEITNDDTVILFNEETKSKLMQILLSKSQNAFREFNNKIKLKVESIKNLDNNNVFIIDNETWSIDKLISALKTFPGNMYDINVEDIFLQGDL